jgi:hypothetical protein
MASNVGSVIAAATAITAVAAGVVVVVPIISRWVQRRKIQRPDEDASPKAPRTDSSWQLTALALFGVTAVLAGLAVLSGTRTSTTGHLSTTDVFTDLAGAGSLLGGVATMLVFLAGYWDRRKRSKQQADTDVLRQALHQIDHSLRPGDIHALADLARALNGNQDSTKENKSREIEPPTS